MGYAQYGTRDGFPVVNAHGGLACRLDVAVAHLAAAEADIRLISPDRPGVGLSDSQPGRTVLDWARDVAELLDQIDVARFAVMGWSMGGQYAAAVGHVLRQRVSRVAIIAGALPLTEPGVFDELPAMDRTLTRMSVRAPLLAAQWFRLMRLAASIAPTLYGRMGARELGPADGEVIRNEGFDAFARMSREAMRRPSGAVEEYRAWMRPWGFTPEELTVPVDVWAGRSDERTRQPYLATSPGNTNPQRHLEYSRRRPLHGTSALPGDLRSAYELAVQGLETLDGSFDIAPYGPRGGRPDRPEQGPATQIDLDRELATGLGRRNRHAQRVLGAANTIARHIEQPRRVDIPHGPGDPVAQTLGAGHTHEGGSTG